MTTSMMGSAAPTGSGPGQAGGAPRRDGAARLQIPASWSVPSSLEAERGVLGSMILSLEAAEVALVKLTEESFYDPRNAAVFRAVAELHEKNLPTDALTLRQRLSDQGQLEAIGGDPYLAQLQSDTPTPANIFSYCTIVRNKHLLRQAMESCARIVGAIHEFPDEPGPVLDEAQAAFFRISEEQGVKEAQSTRDLVMPVMELIERMASNKGKPQGVPTGFDAFDQLTGGLRGGEMIVFAARPGVGKTSFALNVAEFAAVESKKAVGIFSLEMPNEQLMLRLLASRARVDLRRIRTGFTDDQDFRRIAHAADELARAPMYLDDTPGVSLAQLRTKARRMKKKHAIEMVMIDYLQLVQPSAGRKSDSRQADVAEISGGIKAIAKELDIPIVVLCQLNRKPDERQGAPRISDLRESGAIEQDADLVGLLYRENQREEDDSGGTGDLEVALDIQKHRNGPTEKIGLTFLKQFTRFQTRAWKREIEQEAREAL